MGLYELKDAKLGDVDGHGYAYAVGRYRNKTFKGVIFVDEDEVPEDALKADAVEFTGMLYHKTTKGRDTIAVNVKDTVKAGLGVRLDFEEVDDDLLPDEEEMEEDEDDQGE